MPKGIIYVETMPASPDQGGGVPQVVQRHASRADLSVEGIVSARRFAPTDGDGPFIAIYELDCDDLDAVVDRLRELGASGKMTGLDNLAMDPKPIPQGVPRDRVARTVTLPADVQKRIYALMVLMKAADDRLSQGHRHRRVHVRVLAVARAGGHRRRDGRDAARRRPAGHHLPRTARPDRQRRSAGRDLRRDDGAHRRREPRQGRHHAHRQTRSGRDALDGNRRRGAARRRRAGDGRQAQGPRPRHGGELRRRRDEHRVVPRGGEHGRAVGPADGVRLPEQPVRGDDADRRTR